MAAGDIGHPARVFNVNGQPITVSSQCSAVVECNKSSTSSAQQCV
jgi:hypothetical protein